ncbi:MAG TPA: LysM peptidoglycan-binding domain-containing protein [Kofleriaceae bacterium]|nr:LysM peptidoglycan-binding domain-containing protein [Kofleriaceae bacterium]
MQNEPNATGGTSNETEGFQTIDGVELSQASGGYGPPQPYGYTNTGGKPQYYTVKPGDNLTNIAKAHDESLNRLLGMNSQFQANPNLIYPGQRVLTGRTPANYVPYYPCA